MSQIASLSVKLGLVTVDWDKATDKAKQQAKELQKSFNALGSELKTLAGFWANLGGSVGLGSIGLGALIAETASFADRIDDLSKGMGISSGFALQFSDALQQAGVSGDAAGKIIGKLFSSIEEAKLGNQASVDQFRKIGISFDEIKRLSPEDAIKRVFSALSQIADPIERVAMMRKQLGKSGIGLDVQEVDAIIAGGIGNWQKYGDQLEKVSKIKDNLISSMNNLTIAFSAFIAPLTRDGIVSVEKFQAALAGIAVFFAVSKIAAVVEMGTAFYGVAKALLAVEGAAIGLNLAAGGTTPIGILLKGGAALAAFIAYDQVSGNAKARAENNGFPGQPTDTLKRLGIQPSEAGGGRGSINPTTSATGQVDSLTLEETSASMALLAERIKTQQAAVLASIPIWDKYKTQLASIDAEAINAREALKVKTAQLQNQYKENPTLLGIELAKLKEQGKQIDINTARKKLEAKTAQEIALYDQERVRQESYLNGVMTMNAETQQRNLERNQNILNANLKEIDYAKELLQLEIDSNSELSTHEKTLAKESLDYQNSISKLQEQLSALPDYVTALPEEQLSKETELNNQRIDSIKAQMTFENKRHDARVTNLQNERTFEYGMNSTVTQLMDDASNAGKLGSDMATSVFGNMNSALDNFTKTGKLSFKDFARSVIQDLIAIQLKAQATSILGSLFKSLGFGGGGGSGSYSQGVSGYGSEFADGGSPTPNTINLVGERGPELFVPKTAGTIIPNKALSGMGGTTNVTNNYINAIDTKSFEQRLLGSSSAIWAANKYGEKNLASSFGRT